MRRKETKIGKTASRKSQTFGKQDKKNQRNEDSWFDNIRPKFSFSN